MGNVKTLGDALGMPTEEDKEFLRKLLVEYERQRPGEIMAYIEAGKRDLAANGAWNGRQEFGVTGKQAHMRQIFNFPPTLAALIERYFPTMFRDKKHFRWFVKNFKWLMLPEKY